MGLNIKEDIYFTGAKLKNNNTIIRDVITNNIGHFYKDASIFITGSTGFVGKALLEKLLRSCDDIDSVYLLIRPKRGMGCEQRLKELLKNPVFNKIKETNPEVLNKIKIIEGDVSQHNLGISEIDREKLAEKLTMIFHSAATVRFNEDFKTAVVLNTLGTKRVLEFGAEIKNLQSFVHVSTAYSNADKNDVEETVYKPPFDPRSLINCIEFLPEAALKTLEKEVMGDHPNTYTFTKAMAEFIVWEYSAKLPIAIVRPSIVTAAWQEPFPGWVDNISGITGIMMEIGRGSIKSIIADEKNVMDLIPVDVVANTLVTAAWHTVAYRSNSMRVYNCTSGQINKVLWKEIGHLTQTYARQYPTKYLSWYPGFSYRTNRIVHWIYAVLLQRVPACIFDLILYCTKRKPIMYKISKKFERACKTGEFFALHEWNFHTSNIKDLVGAVDSAEDGNRFNIDIRRENGFNWDPYIKDFMLGIRQYVLKDDLSSLPKARVKLNWFYWANRFIQLSAVYFFLKLIIL
ncbi:putative fatty acyl-CoA reductase CG5065 [Onthophagus taurus]|uniref:putative fatty acyl-CoA reductase CG5065 n=1 Tax=Onthophagus taurus TaxID=166361 RepID=UPI000C20FCC0|nr:putative fatty acyl-CoA reductase CG5065 [Onthophagus taurus]XP_022907147.1 putative fatty acyl-CoA reductase CG5065 [Onthophagus taurus]XP_022907148.1 putative fatty acyl-CoA reductase CG5065 [Onthophagus taurus]XP_022907149.1 putative fatty acyl-CoA reductase CG5065 [Onthophagus taurus]XP_022907150.1 putative fatty acyl-CoA reductase CG5065 [Onthophagus taurus]XP_022907151.1 putative fatty acyl-CoA reductase CG5065 [Onthophagus taurus]XP_022907152.1 putative fatty acyl-CoA reductase CG50